MGRAAVVVSMPKRLCGRRNRIFKCCAVLGAFFFILGAAPQPAFAVSEVYQAGYYLQYGCCNAHLDGISADVEVTNVDPADHMCLIWSVLGYTSQGTANLNDDVQLETGDVECGIATSLDGSCSNQNSARIRFVEQYHLQSYVCFPHGHFSIGVADTFSVRRTSTTTTIWNAYIDGTQYEGQNAFDTDNIQIHGWGEATWAQGYTKACGSNWGGTGGLSSLRRYNVDGGWHDINTATEETGCFDVSPLTNNAFTVWHTP
jgi:hypothetical protein